MKHYLSANGMLIASAGMAANLARAYDTWDETGTKVPSGLPRYAPAALLVGAPDLTIHDATAENQYVLGSGEWTDGTTPCAVVFKSSDGFVDVYVGAIDAANRVRFAIVHSGGGLGGNKTGQYDVLKGSAGADGEQSDRTYYPRAGLVSHGVVLLLCEGRHYNAGPFEARTTALVALDTSGGAGAWRWRLVFESAVSQAGQSRGQSWSLQNPWFLDAVASGVLDMWVPWVDYRVNSPSSDGGELFLARATRASDSSPWTIEAQSIFRITSASGLHFHSASAFKFGASGIQLLLSLGDGYQYNRVIQIVRSDLDYMTETPTTPAAGEISGGGGIPALPASNGWTIHDGVHGSGTKLEITDGVWTDSSRQLQSAGIANVTIVGGGTGLVVWVVSGTPGGAGVVSANSGSLATSKAAADTLVLDRDITTNNIDATGIVAHIGPGDRASQFVAQCVGPAEGKLVCGTDENFPDLYVATIDLATAGKRLQFDALFGEMTSHRKGRVCFGVHCLAPHRRSGGWVAPSSHSSLTADGWSTRADSHRVLYSPDCVHWGVASRPNFHDIIDANFHNGRILMGSISTGQGLRSTPIPATKTMRPLCVGRGGTNYLEPALTQRTAPSTGNTFSLVSAANVSQATRAADLAALNQGSIPNPASNGPVYRATHACGLHCGIHSLCSNTPDVPKTKLKIRIGIYALAPKDGDAENTPPYNAVAGGLSLVVGHATATDVFTSFARLSYDTPEIDARGWKWVVVEADPALFTGGTAVPDPFSPAVQIWKQGTLPIRSDCLICFDSVVEGSSVDLPAVPPQVGSGNPASADEAGSVVFPAAPPATAWSVRIAARVPLGSWDQYSLYQPSGLVMATLWESATRYFAISLDPANNRIRVNDSGGGTNVDVTAPAGEVFCFDRGAQILVELVLSGTTLTVYASVGGASIGSASGTVTGVLPSQMRFGDHNGANVRSADWFSLYLNDAEAEDAATARAALRGLAWIPTGEADLASLRGLRGGNGRMGVGL